MCLCEMMHKYIFCCVRKHVRGEYLLCSGAERCVYKETDTYHVFDLVAFMLKLNWQKSP